MADNVNKRSIETANEKLSAHEELQRSYQVLSTLINSIDISNSEWITELFEELNDPIKDNLMAKISNNDEPTELIDTLSTLNKDENEMQPELDDQFFDPAQLQKDLLNVVSLVETAKLKGNKRMDILFAGFQSLKQIQSSMITKTINQYIVDTNLHKLDVKITEMDQLVAKLKASVADKRFVFNQRKADANLSAEDLRHKYEMDVEDTIRGLVITIDRNKQEQTRIEERQSQAVSSIEHMKAALSLLLHEIDREEKDRLVKDFNPVQFFYDINSITSSGHTEGDNSTLITQQAVDESFRMLEEVSLVNTAILDRIATAEDEAKVRRADLNAVLKREDNKALERLKKMTLGLESKIDNDKKRIALLELIVRQIDKDALERPEEAGNRDSFGGGGYHSSQVKSMVRAAQAVSGLQSNNSELTSLLSRDEDQVQSAASAVHRSLYSKYKAAAPVTLQPASLVASDHSAYYSRAGGDDEGGSGRRPLEEPELQDPVYAQPGANSSGLERLSNVDQRLDGQLMHYSMEQNDVQSRHSHRQHNPSQETLDNGELQQLTDARQWNIPDMESGNERLVHWEVNREKSTQESRGADSSRPREDANESITRQSRSPTVTQRSYVAKKSSPGNSELIGRTSVSPGRQSVSPGRPAVRGAIVSATPVVSTQQRIVRRAIPTSQVNRMQQAIDMFDHERSRILMASSAGSNDYGGFDYGDSNSSSGAGDSRHILTYSMPAISALVPDSRLAESIAEQMMQGGQVASLSRSSLIMHNSNMGAQFKSPAKGASFLSGPMENKHASFSKPLGAQQVEEQTDRDEALRDDQSEPALTHIHKGPTRQSMIRRKQQQQMPAREAFSADHFFKSSIATLSTTVAEAIAADKATAATLEALEKSALPKVNSAVSVAPKGPAFRLFDAQRAVVEGQESEASEYYMRTFGYQTALEQLNTLMNILTNYNSNHVSSVDGQVTFSRTAEEELESVESLRHQITSYVQRIKHAYHESHNVQAILKDIQSELSREAREIDLSRAALLQAIEGVKWPHYLKPGEFQGDADACRTRIRELRQEARMWESKVNKKRRANMRLSMMLTSDGGAGRGSYPGGKAAPVTQQQRQNQSNQQQARQPTQQQHAQTKQPAQTQQKLVQQQKQESHQLQQQSQSRFHHNQLSPQPNSNSGMSETDTTNTLDAERATPTDAVSQRAATHAAAATAVNAPVSAVFSTSTTAPDKSAPLGDQGQFSTSTSTTVANTVQRPKAVEVPGGGESLAQRSGPSTPSAPLRRPPAEGSPARNTRPGRQQRNLQHAKPEPHDILRYPLHHTTEAARPSSGQYSVSSNRLAIFHDIADIYDNTLKAFRAAAVSHDSPTIDREAVLEQVGEDHLTDPVTVGAVDASESSCVGNGGEMNGESENDSDEEEGDLDRVGPQLVHFVPPELLLSGGSDHR